MLASVRKREGRKWSKEEEAAAGLVEEVGWLWWELTSWVGVGRIDFDIMASDTICCSDK